MTATNMCSNFVGFRYSPPLNTLFHLVRVEETSASSDSNNSQALLHQKENTSRRYFSD